jgi:hypothetical protein
VLVVVVVVHRHPDVVEHAGGPQQLALVRVARMQPGRGQVVEEPERQRRDMVRVGLVDLVERGEVQDARLAHVGQERRVAQAAQVALEEDPLAQARLRGLELGEAARGHRRADDRGAREDEVLPRGLDAGDPRPVGGRQRREAGDELVERVGGDAHALHPARVGQVPQPLGGGGQVAHRAAHADQARAALHEPGGALELAHDVRGELVQRLARRGALAGRKRSVMRHRAELPRVRGLRQAPGDLDELHRAAAEVQDAAVGQRRSS